VGKVRIRSAEAASVLDANYLFLIGLGEKSFPNLSPPESLLDDAERSQLREQGARLPTSAEERLPGEMLQFHRLIGLPRKELILSYAAVDEKGQPLLPTSFLRSVRGCFVDGAIAVEHQRMPIEGYTTRQPIAPAEWRVQFAAVMSRYSPERGKWSHPRLSADLTANLQDAARMARHRFRSNDFDEFDGMLDKPKIVKELSIRYGPEKSFSPTSLENFVACPFRFMLDNVFGLEPLEEPVEEVEASRRGSAFHRALARFHKRVRVDPQAGLPPDAAAVLEKEIAEAVDEYRRQAGSDAARVLWELEGKRLKRYAAKYPGHWQGFINAWKEKNAPPTPLCHEADFGLKHLTKDGKYVESDSPPLTIEVNGVEVRIGGRIDRVDATELADGMGFWIIDYKTGKSAYYTGADLLRFEKLQLPLYALAVERVLMPNKNARPLGLAYWLVSGSGPKPALPDGHGRYSWVTAPEKWQRFREQLEQWVVELVGKIRNGHFPLSPRSEDCTRTCDFSQICRITQSRGTGKSWHLPLPVLAKEEKKAQAAEA
jgi:ATP-dependent helicase/DNAse subunit B